jgi:hypothetical protein
VSGTVFGSVRSRNFLFLYFSLLSGKTFSIAGREFFRCQVRIITDACFNEVNFFNTPNTVFSKGGRETLYRLTSSDKTNKEILVLLNAISQFDSDFDKASDAA